MKKAEIEHHWQQYGALLKQARQAVGRGDLQIAIELAEASWQHMDGMLRHAAKLDGRTERPLDGFRLVFEYAPILLDHGILNRLEAFLAGKRRIAKSSSSDLGDQLAEARQQMWRCHAVWDALENNGPCTLNSLRCSFSGTDFEWQSLIRMWTAMNLIVATADQGTEHFQFATRLEVKVVVKCPHCGSAARRLRPAIFEPSDCGSCRRQGHFVFISDSQHSER